MKKEEEPEKKPDPFEVQKQAALKRKRDREQAERAANSKKLAQAKLQTPKEKPSLPPDTNQRMGAAIIAASKPLIVERQDIRKDNSFVGILNVCHLPHEEGICRQDDIRLLLKKVLKTRKKANVSSGTNIAVVRLKHRDDTVTIIPSLTGSDLSGHSERLALRDAINKAIVDNKPEFVGCVSIAEDIELNDSRIFDRYRMALHACKVVDIFSDRGPCSHDYKQKNRETCDEFFARILPPNHRFFYGTLYRRGMGQVMTDEIEGQVYWALKFLEYQLADEKYNYSMLLSGMLHRVPPVSGARIGDSIASMEFSTSEHEERKLNTEDALRQLQAKIRIDSEGSLNFSKNAEPHQSASLSNFSVPRPPDFSTSSSSSSSSSASYGAPDPYSSGWSSSSSSSAPRPPDFSTSSSSSSSSSAGYGAPDPYSSRWSSSSSSSAPRAQEFSENNLSLSSYKVFKNQLRIQMENEENLSNNIRANNKIIVEKLIIKLNIDKMHDYICRALAKINNETYRGLMRVTITRAIEGNQRRNSTPPPPQGPA